MWVLVWLIGFCSVLLSDEVPNPKWEKEIQTIEKKFVSGGSRKNGILFVGSSSIRLWKLDRNFPGHPVLNHGFGGSVLSDSVDYFDRLVTPTEPQMIVLYAGDNDIANGKSPETIANDFRKFLDNVRSEVPRCQKVIYISIKPSVKRWSMAEAMQKTNQQIREICESDETADFLDIWPLMLDDTARPRPDLLAEDGLHLNEAGYEIWNNALRPLLTLEPAAKPLHSSSNSAEQKP